IGWWLGAEGWFTLNTDGSLCSPSKAVADSGLIRPDTGRFIKAFTANLGSCLITPYEMRVIVDGLQVVWFLGIRQIRVQSDSIAAIAILDKSSSLDH
ncbi:hypothetical protein LINGRAHAP2_LOCUS14364, partial [Linum grandiflorum]